MLYRIFLIMTSCFYTKPLRNGEQLGIFSRLDLKGYEGRGVSKTYQIMRADIY